MRSFYFGFHKHSQKNSNILGKIFLENIGGLSKLTLAQDTLFLYDDSNFRNKTFITELNKYVSIYGSILYFGNAKSNNEVG